LRQFGSATESASTAILRHPHQHQIMGAWSVDAHGDLVPAGGQHDLLSCGQLARSVVVPSADAIAGPVIYRHIGGAV